VEQRKKLRYIQSAGPWLATREEVPDVSNLNMRLSVNGQVRQRGNTGTMIHAPAELVRYISQFMTLEPGDLISTGTPPAWDSA